MTGWLQWQGLLMNRCELLIWFFLSWLKTLIMRNLWMPHFHIQVCLSLKLFSYLFATCLILVCCWCQFMFPLIVLSYALDSLSFSPLFFLLLLVFYEWSKDCDMCFDKSWNLQGFALLYKLNLKPWFRIRFPILDSQFVFTN